MIGHPFPDLVAYILERFTCGFDIGFTGAISNTRPRNLLSTRSNSLAVIEAIWKEVQRGHTSGNFLVPPFNPSHYSRFVIPTGDSVNDGISKEQYSVKYSSLDDAVALVHALGSQAFMAKLDVRRHAFRLCPVRPDQWALLGYRGAVFC